MKDEVRFDDIRIKVGEHMVKLMEKYNLTYEETQFVNDKLYEMKKCAFLEDNSQTI